MIYIIKIELNSNKRNQLIEITDQVRKILKETQVKEGLCVIYTPHTTAAITINENADRDVKDDIIKGLNSIVPELESFLHYEGNSDAHIKSSVIGASETIIIAEGELCLGMWQGLFFCEFDGPRKRQVYIKIV